MVPQVGGEDGEEVETDAEIPVDPETEMVVVHHCAAGQGAEDRPWGDEDVEPGLRDAAVFVGDEFTNAGEAAGWRLGLWSDGREKGNENTYASC